MSYAILNLTDNYSSSITDGYNMYILDASSNTIDLTLPDCNGYDSLYYTVYCVNSANTVTIYVYSTQSIANVGNSVGISAGNHYNFVSFNGNWYSI
jgi:hypothetical protein